MLDNIIGKYSYSRIKFTEKCIIDLFLRVGHITGFEIGKMTIHNRAVIVRDTVHHFHLQYLGNAEKAGMRSRVAFSD